MLVCWASGCTDTDVVMLLLVRAIGATLARALLSASAALRLAEAVAGPRAAVDLQAGWLQHAAAAAAAHVWQQRSVSVGSERPL